MIAIADVVAVDEIVRVIWASFAAGVGVTLVFSIAIFGSTRFSELRREGRAIEAGFAGAVAVAGLLAVLGAVAIGIWVVAV